MLPQLGKTLIIMGAVIALFGAILVLSGKFPWLGRLPGDIHIRRENFSFYFPLATSLLLSVALSLLLWLFRR
jgi:hypothetical protein